MIESNNMKLSFTNFGRIYVVFILIIKIVIIIIIITITIIIIKMMIIIMMIIMIITIILIIIVIIITTIINNNWFNLLRNEMRLGNENIEKKPFGKRGFYLNGFVLKKFAQNLIAGIRELWIVEKSFCDDISQKRNQWKECKLYHDSGIVATENNTFSEEHALLCTSSKQKNDCHYKEAKIKLNTDGLIKIKNLYPNNLIMGYLNIDTIQNKIIRLR